MAVGIRGGARWEYSDLATILQVFQKDNDRWEIISHIESFKLDNNIVSKPPESVPNRRAPFTFDFVYPVKDLKRAILINRETSGMKRNEAERNGIVQS